MHVPAPVTLSRRWSKILRNLGYLYYPFWSALRIKFDPMRSILVQCNEVSEFITTETSFTEIVCGSIGRPLKQCS